MILIQVDYSHVTVAFGFFYDHVIAVHEAAECVAHAMMSQLSTQGVKACPSIFVKGDVCVYFPLSLFLFNYYCNLLYGTECKAIEVYVQRSISLIILKDLFID